MNRIIRIITLIILFSLIAATVAFTYLQVQRGQTLDEALVSDLTTQLDTVAIDQAIKKINSHLPK